jgi:CelD/BcsL family acetyltransferase involved in cellulose biosynthesis
VTGSLRPVWIADGAAFRALEPEWNALLQRASRRSVFFTHAWLDAAWTWAADLGEPMVVCVYSEDRLVGACALMLKRDSRFPRRRVLRWLEIPDTQECDIVCEEAHAERVIGAIAAELYRRRGEWDLLDLCYLHADSIAARGLLGALPARGIQTALEEDDSNPYIDTEGPWDQFYAARSRSLKKATNLAANRIARAGNVRVTRIPPLPSRVADVARTLEDLVHVSARSWKAGTGNTLEQPAPGRFFRRLAELATERGWLSAWVLYLNDRPAATELQLVYDGQVHALRSDFDQALEEVSPGSNLNIEILKALFASGVRRYFMGPGPNPYKRRWTDSVVPLCRLSAYSPTLRGASTGWFDHELRPRLRRVREGASELVSKKRSAP